MGTSETGRCAKFYSLTLKGRKEIEQETENWERIAATMARILAPLDWDALMDWIRILLNRSKAFFRRKELDADLDEELRAHIDLAAQLPSAMSGFFAALALLLSGIGIYGLVAWNVSQRTREIGVRMALGATRSSVFLMVLRQHTVLLVTGLAAGAVASYFAARAVHSFLYEIEAEDREYLPWPRVSWLGSVCLRLRFRRGGRCT